MRTLTDGSLHNHSIRSGGALAVSSSVDCLDLKHVAFPGRQAVADKPENKGVKCLILTLHLDFINSKLQF